MKPLSVPPHAPFRTIQALTPDLCNQAALVLCDLDGCLISEGRAFADAPAFVEACGERLWVVSNNSSDTAQSMSEILAQNGLDIPAHRILLAGEQTVHHLARRHPGARLNLYGSPLLRANAHAAGFTHDERPAEIALLCRDPSVSIQSMGHLAADIRQGAAFWVSNTDITHPGLNGQSIPETGVLLAALRAILPKAHYSCVGKPDPFLLSMALEKSKMAPEQSIFVGDNALTDGEAAWAAAIHFVHLVRDGGNP